MPCILKRPAPDSPGIITFTHNEALRGLPAHSDRVRAFLNESQKDGKWLAGVHVQGFVDYLKNWPLEPWQDFVLWTDPDQRVFKDLPSAQVLDMNCINFMPAIPPAPAGQFRKHDVIVIGHASSIKRIHEVMQIIRHMFDLKPDLRVMFVVPDQRDLARGLDTYVGTDIDRRYYELPQTLFSSAELKQISFVSSSTHAFGKFPLESDVVWGFLKEAKFLLSFSYEEGTPRIFPEALMCGTICAINEKTRFGFARGHDNRNTLWLKDDVRLAAEQLVAAIKDPSPYSIDQDKVRRDYVDVHNFARFKAFFAQRMLAHGFVDQGEWFLDELYLRLPCHGKKINHQFMNREELFFDWIDKVVRLNPYDEDATLGLPPLKDDPTLLQRALAAKGRARGELGKIVKKAREMRSKLSPS